MKFFFKIKSWRCVLIINACLLLLGCVSNTDSIKEQYHDTHENIRDISDGIVNIETNYIFGRSKVYIVDDVLVLLELNATDKGIHLFDKNTFKYLTSTGKLGKGPGEIGSYGYIMPDGKNRRFHMMDYGKKDVLLEFSLDSILNFSDYQPHQICGEQHYSFFMLDYAFINDSVALGMAGEVINSNSFLTVMAQLNIHRNELTKFGYQHPAAANENKSVSKFAVSQDNGVYVRCHMNCDLLTIGNLSGDLMCNVYGPGWNVNAKMDNVYYTGVSFVNNYIIASYVGDKSFAYDEYQRPRTNWPTKFKIFELNGRYIETVEIGHEFQNFCVDEANNRVIIYFEDRPTQLGYINLKRDDA